MLKIHVNIFLNLRCKLKIDSYTKVIKENFGKLIECLGNAKIT